MRHPMCVSETAPGPAKAPGGSQSERGSALIIAVLVMVILTLLGISYLMLAQTENQIAENQLNAQQALFVAEGGARLVMNWFNDPTATGYLVPTAAQVNRTIRWYDHDATPGPAVVKGVAADPAKPIYRDGTDDLFEKAYRGSNFLSFLGEESHAGGDEGPDLRIDAAAGGGQATFLNTVNNPLFSSSPTPNRRARITRIDLYSPPLIDIGGQKIRFGIATLKVTAGVFLFPGTAQERQVAQRVTKVVLAEVPYPGDFGPLTSCNFLSTSGDLQVHWGFINAAANFQFNTSSLDNKMDSGFPYDDSGAPGFPNTHITGATLAAACRGRGHLPAEGGRANGPRRDRHVGQDGVLFLRHRRRPASDRHQRGWDLRQPDRRRDLDFRLELGRVHLPQHQHPLQHRAGELSADSGHVRAGRAVHRVERNGRLADRRNLPG